MIKLLSLKMIIIISLVENSQGFTLSETLTSKQQKDIYSKGQRSHFLRFKNPRFSRRGFYEKSFKQKYEKRRRSI